MGWPRQDTGALSPCASCHVYRRDARGTRNVIRPTAVARSRGRCDASVVGFEWDPTLYSGSAPFYLEGRLPYAPGMADALARALELDGRGRLLDVGCGPGIVALELASLFEQVVGLDADPDMIAEAEAETRRRGVENARWEHLRAEELPAGLGRFRVATLAQSFHWMQRERVASTFRALVVGTAPV
jgi:2-polyprenyl-3-methyl-5-hydroxy-6-metoxy-1,4-benzoquinol methylase